MWGSRWAVPAALVATACTEVGISTLFKAAMRKGLTQFVYIFYSNLFALCLLVPACCLYYRKRPRPQLKRPILFRVFLAGLLSCCVQLFMNTGIRFSSPTMSAAMTDLTPAFTFLLAVISRMETLECRLHSSQAKSVGTTVSVVGALIVTFYKGIPLTGLPSESSLLDQPAVAPSNWALGGVFCALGAWCISSMYVVQTWVLRDFPAELIMTCISCFVVAVISFIVALIADHDLNAWILKPDIKLLAIICSAIFAAAIRNLVHVWSCHEKGPLYTAMFNPLGMIIATLLGVFFLGDTLYIGSVIGGTIIALGFYTVLWGKAQEEQVAEEKIIPDFESSSSPKVPLLQNKTVDV